MKNARRITALILCLIMCVAAVSCAKGGDNEALTTAPVADATEMTVDPGAETTLSETEYTMPEVNFNNAEVMVLYWEDVERPEFFVDSQTGDIINDAIFDRNLAIEDTLGVKLAFKGTPGNVGNSDNYKKFVENSFNAGEKAYDILASHSRTGAVVAASGLTQDILAVDDSYLDFTKPWWPQAMIETATIGNSMYFVSGDISTNTLHFMYGIYYNVDLITNYGLEDPAQIALAGNWTLDKLISMTTNTYNDLNNNNVKDYGDFFGLSTLYYHADSFYFGCGMKCIDKSDTTTLCVSPDFTSEKAINLSEKLGAWFSTNDCYTTNDSYTHKMFAEGNALFCQNRIYIADSTHTSGLNGASFKYSLVPNPKYDENQDRYYTTVGNPFTLYEIMVDCDQASMVTAVLECWGMEGYKLTTPAIFEINMKYKYASDDTTAQVFDIIRGNIVFDLGRIFGAKLSTMSEIYSKACISNSPWSSMAATNKKVITKQVEKLLDSFN